MFSWMNKDENRKKEPEVFASVADGLKKLYQQVQNFCFITVAIFKHMRYCDVRLTLINVDLNIRIISYMYIINFI